MYRRSALHAVMTLLIVAAALAIGVAGHRHAPASDSTLRLSAAQTVSDPGDLAFAVSGESATAITYRKMAIPGVAPSFAGSASDTGEGTVIVYRSDATGGGGGLAWTGEAVLATVILGSSVTALGILLLILARRRRENLLASL